jgi:hypothetical protein
MIAIVGSPRRRFLLLRSRRIQGVGGTCGGGFNRIVFLMLDSTPWSRASIPDRRESRQDRLRGNTPGRERARCRTRDAAGLLWLTVRPSRPLMLKARVQAVLVSLLEERLWCFAICLVRILRRLVPCEMQTR